mgnify:CR=1 FL=1
MPRNDDVVNRSLPVSLDVDGTTPGEFVVEMNLVAERDDAGEAMFLRLSVALPLSTRGPDRWGGTVSRM